MIGNEQLRLAQIIEWTALVRHTRQWELGRATLLSRDFDPEKCVVVAVGPADYASLVIVTQKLVAHYLAIEQDKMTRQFVLVDDSSPAGPDEWEREAIDLARNILSGKAIFDFNERVRAFHNSRGDT